MNKLVLPALLTLAACSTADSRGVRGEEYEIEGRPGLFGLGSVDRGEMITEARERCPDGWDILYETQRRNGMVGTEYVMWRIRCR